MFNPSANMDQSNYIQVYDNDGNVMNWRLPRDTPPLQLQRAEQAEHQPTQPYNVQPTYNSSLNAFNFQNGVQQPAFYSPYAYQPSYQPTQTYAPPSFQANYPPANYYAPPSYYNYATPTQYYNPQYYVAPPPPPPPPRPAQPHSFLDLENLDFEPAETDYDVSQLIPAHEQQTMADYDREIQQPADSAVDVSELIPAHEHQSMADFEQALPKKRGRKRKTVEDESANQSLEFIRQIRNNIKVPSHDRDNLLEQLDVEKQGKLKICEICGHISKTHREKNKHNAIHRTTTYNCEYCGLSVLGGINMRRHIRQYHERSIKCPNCYSSFISTTELAEHRRRKHKDGSSLMRAKRHKDSHMFVERGAFGGVAKIFSTVIKQRILDPEGFRLDDVISEEMKKQIANILSRQLKELDLIKFQIFTNVLYNRIGETEDVQPTPASFITKFHVISHKSDINDTINKAWSECTRQFDRNPAEKSSWLMRSVEDLDVRVTQFKPQVGGCSAERLPPELAGKYSKSLVSIQNDDNMCFYWCLAAAQYIFEFQLSTQTDAFPPNLQNKRLYEHIYDDIMATLTHSPAGAVSTYDVRQIGEQLGVSINVYGWKQDVGIYPITVAGRLKEMVVNMLLYNDHYYLIPKLGSLVRRKGSASYSYWCHRCLYGTDKPSLLERHMQLCLENMPQRVTYPAESNKFFEFTHFYKKLRVPLVIYADFESTLDPNTDNENILHKHVSNSFAFVVVNSDGQVVHKELGWALPEDELPRRHTAVGNFLYRLDELKKRFLDLLNPNMPMDKSNWDQIEEEFNTKTHCHICDKTLYERWPVYDAVMDYKHTLCKGCATNAGQTQILWQFKTQEDYQACIDTIKCHECNEYLGRPDVVMDHDHVTGKFRGPAHKNCNLNYSAQTESIPVFFHNLKGYDGHFIIRELGGLGYKVEIIAENYIKYKCINIGAYKFIDSMAFLNESLEKLADRHFESKLPYKVMAQVIKPDGEFVNFIDRNDEVHVTDEMFDKLKCKGAYPYEYVDSLQRLEETKFPSIEAFYSSLKGASLSSEDYERSKEIYYELGCRNLRDYHINYLWRDVALLAEVFESFRDLSQTEYKLDPAHFISLPSLSLSACQLKMREYWYLNSRYTFNHIDHLREDCIELLTKADHHDMIDRGFRGGLSVITKRRDFYKPSDPVTGEKGTQLLYIDANNLYGYAMCQPLPFGRFKLYSIDNPSHGHLLTEWEAIAARWCEPDDVPKLPVDEDTGYEIGAFVECDLDYPKELHDLHNDLPFCMEHAVLSKNEYGDYQTSLMKLLDAHDQTNRKLIAGLNDKRGYVMHITHLQLALKHGLKLKRITRALTFLQAPYLAEYILGNNERRARAKNEFEKNFFKLMNNSVYGKFCENKRERKKVTLVNNERLFEQKVRSPYLTYIEIITNDLVIAGRIDENVYLDKPKYIGAAILELAKVHMYKIHYDHIKKHDLNINMPNAKTHFPDGRVWMCQVGQEWDPTPYHNVEWGWNLLFHDTDSFCYSVKTHNLHSEIMHSEDLKPIMDLSNYPPQLKLSRDESYFNFAHSAHELYLNRVIDNDKKLGMMKDEMSGGVILQFVGLKPKAYGIEWIDLALDSHMHLKHKGVKKQSVNLEDMLDVFGNEKLVHTVRQVNIRCDKRHNVVTEQRNKKALNALDTKRHILPDMIHTLAPGHFRIALKPTNYTVN